eukprot:gene28530-35380_t
MRRSRYHRNIDTLASNRPFRAVHAAERSDRSAGTCEQRGILDCGRRRFDWPILPTAMFNALIGVAIGAPVTYVGVNFMAVYSELRQVMEYALIVNENRVYARTLQDAQRE